jgi:hypothetical protein
VLRWLAESSAAVPSASDISPGPFLPFFFLLEKSLYLILITHSVFVMRTYCVNVDNRGESLSGLCNHGSSGRSNEQLHHSLLGGNKPMHHIYLLNYLIIIFNLLRLLLI